MDDLANANNQTIISGGPGIGDNPPPTENIEGTGAVAAKKPLFQGLGRTIETQEDLVDYTAQLERQNVEMRLAKEKEPPTSNSFQPMASQPPPAQNSNNQGATPADLLFSDPEKALQMVEQQALNKFEAKQQAKDQEKKFWSDLYKENPDLQNADIVVKSVLNENWAEISKAPLSQARKILAEKSRTIVKGIRGDGSKVTEVPNTSQATLGASNGVQTSKPAPAKTASFIDQVKKLQRKG